MCLLSILLSTWLVIMISNHLTHHQMSIYNLKLWMELTVNSVLWEFIIAVRSGWRAHCEDTYMYVRNGFGSQCSWMLTDTDRNQQRIGNCWAQSLVTGSCITDINYLVSDSDRVALGCYSRCRFQMRRITSASVLIKFVEVLILMTISDTNISGLCSHNVISMILLSWSLICWAISLLEYDHACSRRAIEPNRFHW